MFSDGIVWYKEYWNAYVLPPSLLSRGFLIFLLLKSEAFARHALTWPQHEIQRAPKFVAGWFLCCGCGLPDHLPGVLPLMESGVINNSMKSTYRGRTISSFIVGSRKLYDF
eukprot:4716354-Amphidinium_carterae.1